MIQRVDLNKSENLFVVASILVCGIGGLYFGFGHNGITKGALLEITSLAAALIVGLITNLIVNIGKTPEVPEAPAKPEVTSKPKVSAAPSDSTKEASNARPSNGGKSKKKKKSKR